MDNLIGKVLDDSYRLDELIGVGGMANVYRAYDLKKDRTVAIKVLREEFLDNVELVRRFKNESRAISVLNHPNIVKVYDVSITPQLQYIVMEYLNGITLKEYLKQRGRALPWKEAIHFVAQVLTVERCVQWRSASRYKAAKYYAAGRWKRKSNGFWHCAHFSLRKPNCYRQGHWFCSLH